MANTIESGFLDTDASCEWVDDCFNVTISYTSEEAELTPEQIEGIRKTIESQVDDNTNVVITTASNSEEGE
ncbi:MAG: hypothetical protein K6A05_08080 [Lachnospiraceae bacterium]|nr:hypothetical protein [Lachnospiraceae bacterium]